MALPHDHFTDRQDVQEHLMGDNDNRIPVTGLQLSIFLIVVLFIGFLGMELLLVPLAAFVVSMAIYRLFGGAPFDFAGFQFVSTSPDTIVYKEKIVYVPVEKHVTHYIVKDKHVTRYIVKEKHITHYIVKDTVIDTTSLVPPVAVETIKPTTLLQWLDGFSALDPVRDLLTSKLCTKPKRNGDTIASPPTALFPSPLSFLTTTKKLNSGPRIRNIPPSHLLTPTLGPPAKCTTTASTSSTTSDPKPSLWIPSDGWRR
jgi:hypothetical protein